MEEKSFTVRFLTDRYNAIYIKTDETARRVVQELLKEGSGLIGLDTETAGRYDTYDDEALSPILGEVRLLQLFDGTSAYIFDLRFVRDLTVSRLLDSKKFIAHNALFDLAMLKGSNLPVREMGCTFIAGKLLVHEKYAKDYEVKGSLREMTELLFKEDILKVLQDSNWSNDNLTFEQIEYAALDAVCTLKIAQKLGPALHKKKLDRIYQLYKKAQYPIVEMELNGVGFDRDAHHALVEISRHALLLARKEVLELTGLTEITPHKLSGWLETKLRDRTITDWPRTKSGKLSTAAATFEEYRDLEIFTPITKFNDQTKLLSTFGPKLLSFVNPVTKRIHAKYNIAGARTGRLSSRNPNIQQMPRKKEFRNIFVPEEGYVLICADFSQIEVRIAAEISGDDKMKDVYRRGADIYKETAGRILKKPLESITKFERQCAKAVVLGSQFGLGAKKFSQYARLNYGIEDLTEEKAQEFIDAYRKAYPRFREWQQEQTKECEKSLKASTVFGKVRALERDNYYGQALNHPVQGSAAEVMLCSLINFYEAKEKNSLLVACVHDEILVEAKEDTADRVKCLLEECMIRGFLQVFPQGITNGLVEAKIGTAWGEAK